MKTKLMTNQSSDDVIDDRTTSESCAVLDQLRRSSLESNAYLAASDGVINAVIK